MVSLELDRLMVPALLRQVMDTLALTVLPSIRRAILLGTTIVSVRLRPARTVKAFVPSAYRLPPSFVRSRTVADPLQVARACWGHRTRIRTRRPSISTVLLASVARPVARLARGPRGPRGPGTPAGPRTDSLMAVRGR